MMMMSPFHHVFAIWNYSFNLNMTFLTNFLSEDVSSFLVRAAGLRALSTSCLTLELASFDVGATVGQVDAPLGSRILGFEGIDLLGQPRGLRAGRSNSLVLKLL